MIIIKRNYSREDLIRHASLTDPDIEQVNQCRRDYNRLGFGYQIGFVRLENRLPTQYKLEIIDDLLTFTSVQLQIDLSWLNNNYQRSLAAYVRQCDVHRLREVERYHRYGAMACFLWQTYQDTIKKRKREDVFIPFPRQ